MQRRLCKQMLKIGYVYDCKKNTKPQDILQKYCQIGTTKCTYCQATPYQMKVSLVKYTTECKNLFAERI